MRVWACFKKNAALSNLKGRCTWTASYDGILLPIFARALGFFSLAFRGWLLRRPSLLAEEREDRESCLLFLDLSFAATFFSCSLLRELCFLGLPLTFLSFGLRGAISDPLLWDDSLEPLTLSLREGYLLSGFLDGVLASRGGFSGDSIFSTRLSRAKRF